MRGRDALDVVLVVATGLLAFVTVVGTSGPQLRLDAVLAVLFGLDLVVYLVLGLGLGVLFVGYIAVYLPRKESGRRAR